MAALTTAMIGLTVASAGASVYGNAQQSKAIKKEDAFQRQIADIQATDALNRGAKDEGRIRAETRNLISSQRTALAAQGLDINSGSALDVQLESAGYGEADALTIRNNARLEAWGIRTQSNLNSAAARSQRRALGVASVGTVLTAGLQVGYTASQGRGPRAPRTPRGRTAADGYPG